MCALVGPYSISNYTLGVIFVFSRSVKKPCALLVIGTAGLIFTGCSGGPDEAVESFDSLTVINEHCAVDWGGHVYIGMPTTEVETAQYSTVQSTIWMSADGPTMFKDGSVVIDTSEKHESQLIRDCREDAKNTRWRW